MDEMGKTYEMEMDEMYEMDKTNVISSFRSDIGFNHCSRLFFSFSQHMFEDYMSSLPRFLAKSSSLLVENRRNSTSRGKGNDKTGLRMFVVLKQS